MTVSTPPSNRILPGLHDASQCRAERPIGRAKNIFCLEIIENKVFSLFLRLEVDGCLDWAAVEGFRPARCYGLAARSGRVG